MTGIWEHLKKFDWLMLAAVFILCAISLITLRGIDMGGESNYFLRQSVFFVISFFAMLIASFLEARIFKNRPAVLIGLYFSVILILVAVLFSGSKIRGSVSWFSIGSLRFEPVELAKLVVVLILAKYFSGRHVEMYRLRHVIISAGYAFLPVGLVLLQPDLGSALIVVFTWLGVVLLSGIKTRHLIAVLLLGVVISLATWGFVLKNYQKDRILTFLNPSRDPLGSSYNLIQAKTAIGSGGLWGEGLGRGSQSQLNFLPEPHSDFIFAVFAEEWGFFGVIFLCSVFLFIFYRLVRISISATNNFFRLTAAGYALLLLVQIFINVGMNLGIMPITGISLPFLSYGGSNLLVNFLALGIIQNIAIQSKDQYRELEKE